MAVSESQEPKGLNRKECWKIVNEAFDEALRIAHDRLFDHPFTRELKAGTLPIECIRGWLLNSYAWALEINSSAAYKYYLFNDLLSQKVDLLAMLADKRGDEYATPRRGGHPRPSNAAARGSDAQPRRAPERVLGFLHVPEEPSEMHDAGRIDLVILHAAREPVLRGAGGFRHQV